MNKRYCLTMIVKFTTEAEDQVKACQNILKDLRYNQNILEYQMKSRGN